MDCKLPSGAFAFAPVRVSPERLRNGDTEDRMFVLHMEFGRRPCPWRPNSTFGSKVERGSEEAAKVLSGPDTDGFTSGGGGFAVWNSNTNDPSGRRSAMGAVEFMVRRDSRDFPPSGHRHPQEMGGTPGADLLWPHKLRSIPVPLICFLLLPLGRQTDWFRSTLGIEYVDADVVLDGLRGPRLHRARFTFSQLFRRAFSAVKGSLGV